MEVEFLGSFSRFNLPPEKYPEVCIIGRSNVGKSSFINAMVGRRNLARISSTPGKTRSINMFLCERKFVLVDLPGFGYAGVPRAERRRWTGDVEHYIEHRRTLDAVVLLVDIRHFPMPIDAEAVRWLESLGKPFVVVMTKADKVRRGQLARLRADISGLSGGMAVESIRFSAKTGLGKKEVWHWMARTLST
jgi:GTP-binding protein